MPSNTACSDDPAGDGGGVVVGVGITAGAQAVIARIAIPEISLKQGFIGFYPLRRKVLRGYPAQLVLVPVKLNQGRYRLVIWQHKDLTSFQ